MLDSMTNAYEKFLEQKKISFLPSGFGVAELNPILFPFQDWITRRALQKGRFAVFADCGLGKTFIQLEWAQKVADHTKQPVLILCPLAVSGQTIAEGLKLGISVLRYKNQCEPGIYISNYDQLDNINCSLFGGIVLDESSILKNFEGKIRNKIISAFAKTPYKLACTATPSPNDPVEIGNHAEFLNVMSLSEMKAMYFINDQKETQKWRLKKHAYKAFYEWISQWAVMIEKPSDVGFSDDGYELPELHLIEKQIETPKKDDGLLFNNSAVSATDFNAELRLTKIERMAEVAEIVNKSSENFIIWIKQDEEGSYLRSLIPDAIEVRGSDKPEYKEQRLLGFAKNEFRVLITKAKIAQFGLNYQNCHNQIFASLDFSFESLYQAIRRSYRFKQIHPVNIYIITTDTMQNVIQSIKSKQAKFKTMQKAMTDAINLTTEKPKQSARVRGPQELVTENAVIKRGDCVRLVKEIPNESIGFSIFSPPFAELYVYSDELEDMGNSKDYKEFLVAFNFLVKDLYRVLMSGRNVAVHCMDLPIQKGKEGVIALRDFSGMILRAFESAGFIYHSRVTIWKNPVTEMQRTKALGLLHKQIKKDSTMSRVGIPDYLLIFRKDGERDNPVKCDISVDTWQQYASPVWMDIDYSNTLNVRAGRGDNDEKHICPLQLDTIKRAIHLYTNPGDTVLTPFLGIGSEVYEAVRMGRKGIGFELKESYFQEAVKNVQSAEEFLKQGKLFH